MELTPQQLCDVEFSEQWRGYNRDQVDDFIERIAAAVSTLQDRLRKMTERAVRAEQRSLEGTEADGAARRTLVLAQRTADATVAEAKDTAARLVAQAQEEARAIILAAETANEAMPSVEPTARAEIADLEVTRSRLQADVAALESHVTDRRARIKDLLDELQRRVDEGLDGRIALWPSADDGIVTGEADVHQDDGTGLFDIESPAPVEDEDIPDGPLAETSAAGDMGAGEPRDTGNGADDAVELAPVPPEWEAFDLVPEPSREVPEPSHEPSHELRSGPAQHTNVTEDMVEADNGHHDLAVPTPVPGYDELSARDVDDDTFFAHLRGALDDDAPLGPREEAHGLLRWREEAATALTQASSLYDQGEPERRKFGRKKRRQR